MFFLMSCSGVCGLGITANDTILLTIFELNNMEFAVV